MLIEHRPFYSTVRSRMGENKSGAGKEEKEGETPW
jgi:hypothetical protein